MISYCDNSEFLKISHPALISKTLKTSDLS